MTWQPPATNPGSVTGYQVSIGDVSKTVTAAERNGTLSALQAGQDYTFKVVAIGSGNFLSPAATVTVRGTATTLKVAKAGAKTMLTGVLNGGREGRQRQGPQGATPRRARSGSRSARPRPARAASTC